MMTEPDLHCDNCGRLYGPGDRYCVGCGAQLTPREVPPSADAGEVPWTVAHVTGGLLLFLGLLIAVAFVARAVASPYPSHELHLLAVGVGAIVWFLGARRAASPQRALGLTIPRTSLGISALMALAALGASILATFTYGLAVEGLELDYLRPPEIEKEILFPGVGILLTLQALAIVTPISEEVLFRGFALRGLLGSIGRGPAVVATAVVFSALHLEPGAMIPIFITGLALGWLYVKTGSLWPCVAAHAGQNTLALLAARFL